MRFINRIRNVRRDKELTGRVIFSLNEGNKRLTRPEDWGNELPFHCGPESGSLGQISDVADVYEVLEEVLRDIPGLEVGAAESFHTVELAENTVQARTTLWETIKAKLIAAGAIHIEYDY